MNFKISLEIVKQNFYLTIIFFLFLQACSIQNITEETLLFNFEGESELDRIDFKCKTRFQLSNAYKNEGNTSLEMNFYPTDRVGFILKDLKYKINEDHSLSFWAYNPSLDTSILFVKIEVNNTSKYIYQSELKNGENIIKLSFKKLSKDFITKDIKTISIYRENIDHIETIYFDDFKITI